MRFFILFALGAVLVAGGCKKKEKPVAKKDEPAAPAVDPRNTNYVQGGGAVQNVRQAAKRTVQLNDMHQLGLLISTTVQLDDRMPGASEIKESLKRDAPTILAAINEGTIILTDTKNKGGLWAYEIDADKAGGIVLVAGTASRASADQVQQFLANK
jgi:hypothetical protein